MNDTMAPKLAAFFCILLAALSRHSAPATAADHSVVVGMPSSGLQCSISLSPMSDSNAAALVKLTVRNTRSTAVQFVDNDLDELTTAFSARDQVGNPVNAAFYLPSSTGTFVVGSGPPTTTDEAGSSIEKIYEMHLPTTVAGTYEVEFHGTVKPVGALVGIPLRCGPASVSIK